MDKSRSKDAKRRSIRRRWERLAKLLRSDVWSNDHIDARRCEAIAIGQYMRERGYGR